MTMKEASTAGTFLCLGAANLLIANLTVCVLAAQNPSPDSTRSIIEQFTRYAEFETVAISPKGTYLAVTQRKDDEATDNRQPD